MNRFSNYRGEINMRLAYLVWTLILFSSCNSPSHSGDSPKGNEPEKSVFQIGGGSKEIELMGVNTSWSVENFKEKTPSATCKKEKITPDCDFDFMANYCVMGQGMSQRIKYQEELASKGVFYEVDVCEFVPDVYQEAKVSVTFFNNKVENFRRPLLDENIKVKIMVKSVINSIENKLGIKPTEIAKGAIYDTIPIWMAFYNLGDDAELAIAGEGRLQRSESIDLDYTRSIRYDRKKLQPFLKKYLTDKYQESKTKEESQISL
jgi:hypothetical protein